jgi:ribosomal-protein-alanine N-acetyltransferase
VRLGQEVQEVPRRLTAPDPPLADDVLRLEPLTQADHADLAALVADPDVQRFTRIPTDAGAAFVRGWIERYEAGWRDGTCAGFAARDVANGAFLAFAGIVQLELDARQGEIGYAVAPAARGRGVARRIVDMLTSWGFDELGLIRLELDIDVENPASARVAEYRLEGVRRSLHFKEGKRADTGLWSRLRDDEPGR